jgi:catechol 2,3-dioxygenase-like lactoylglutathione lyase family enzyme
MTITPDTDLTPTRATMPVADRWGAIIAEVTVSDVARSLRFWTRGLGFELQHRQLDDPDYVVLSHPHAAPSSYVVLVSAPDRETYVAPSSPVVQLEHPDPAAVAHRCLDEGYGRLSVRTVRSRTRPATCHVETVAFDPDGNGVRIVGRPAVM